MGYYTFDELPFWSQGRGVWNGNRNALAAAKFVVQRENVSIDRRGQDERKPQIRSGPAPRAIQEDRKKALQQVET